MAEAIFARQAELAQRECRKCWLIVFSGARNEKEGDVGTHYYEFRAGKFILIKSVLSKKP